MARSLAEHTIFLDASEEHIDELQHVNNVVYVKWVQDIAGLHWLEAAPLEIKEQCKWVVVNHNIHYKRSIKLGERVKIHTQVADDASGATWGRNVWIYNQAGQLAAEAFTQWCMIDAYSFRPKRITQDIISVFIKDE